MPFIFKIGFIVMIAFFTKKAINNDMERRMKALKDMKLDMGIRKAS